MEKLRKVLLYNDGYYFLDLLCMFRIEIGPGIWKFDSGKEGKTVVIMV